MPWAPPTEARYRIEIRSRQTGARRAGCSITAGAVEAEWRRTTDTTSDASVKINAANLLDGCADCRPVEWDDELVFYRDDDPTPAWGPGPIVSMTDEAGDLTIRAVDRSANIGDREAAADHPAIRAGDTPTVQPLDLIRWIVEQASRRDPVGLRVVGYPSDHVGLVTAKIAAGDPLGAVLSQLGEGDVDWTVVGPTMHVGLPTVTLPALPVLSCASHWADGGAGASLDRSGVAVCSHVIVHAAGGVRVIFPADPQPERTYRPLRVVRELMTSRPEVERYAAETWADAQEPQVTISTGSSSLASSSPVTVQDLIPGRVVTVAYDVGVLRSAAAQRLSSVTVRIGSVVDGDGWALAEQSVSVEFQPAKRRTVQTRQAHAANGQFAAGDEAVAV